MHKCIETQRWHIYTWKKHPLIWWLFFFLLFRLIIDLAIKKYQKIWWLELFDNDPKKPVYCAVDQAFPVVVTWLALSKVIISLLNSI